MGTLAGTERDPRRINSPIDRVAVYDSGRADHIEVLEDQLAVWKAFEGTKSGQVVKSLAEPKIQSFVARLAIKTEDLRRKHPTLSPQELELLRAEWRGALFEWQLILYGADTLQKELNTLTETLEKERKKLEDRENEQHGREKSN